MKTEKQSEIMKSLSKQDFDFADRYYSKKGMFSAAEAFSIAGCYFDEIVDVLNPNK